MVQFRYTTLHHGFELLQSLNECIDKEMVPPFLFLTARITQDDIRKGMELGADDYITKPFNPIELLDIIKSKIEKRKKIISIAVEDEQDRISIELHDNIQQLLVVSQMGFKSMKEEITVLSKESQNIFERSLGFLMEATTEVRNISHNISKKPQINLKSKVLELIEQLEDTSKIKTSLDYNVEIEIEDNKSIELYKVIQEAINNIVKSLMLITFLS